MTDSVDQLGQAPNQRPLPVWGTALANAARAAGPPLLFGLRLWASVCLALYVAFWLQLENPYWEQPRLSFASLILALRCAGAGSA